jgi:hypothetical protein
MRAEAVHPVASLEALHARLGPRRAVFAFTHPAMPGEPLVVLHTALMERVGRPGGAQCGARGTRADWAGTHA